ncbi:MAG: hypothetical protein ACOH1K_04115 [Rhodoglobus sp.]
MTSLTNSSPPTVQRSESERHSDLAADISALVVHGVSQASTLQSRPAILRRLAASVASSLPAGIDRLVARADTEASLVTAVSLHSGVPFALLDHEGAVVMGDCYPSERVVMVETFQHEVTQRSVPAVVTLLGVATAISFDPDGDYVFGNFVATKETKQS